MGDAACKKPGCRREDMIRYNTKYCEERRNGCRKTAQFGDKTDLRRKYCGDHAKNGMVNVQSTFCACGTMASWGFPRGPRTHCAPCSLEGMSDKTKRRKIARPVVQVRVTAVDLAAAAMAADLVESSTPTSERGVVDGGEIPLPSVAHVSTVGAEPTRAETVRAETARAPTVNTTEVAAPCPSPFLREAYMSFERRSVAPSPVGGDEECGREDMREEREEAREVVEQCAITCVAVASQAVGEGEEEHEKEVRKTVTQMVENILQLAYECAEGKGEPSASAAVVETDSVARTAAAEETAAAAAAADEVRRENLALVIDTFAAQAADATPAPAPEPAEAAEAPKSVVYSSGGDESTKVSGVSAPEAIGEMLGSPIATGFHDVEVAMDLDEGDKEEASSSDDEDEDHIQQDSVTRNRMGAEEKAEREAFEKQRRPERQKEVDRQTNLEFENVSVSTGIIYYRR